MTIALNDCGCCEGITVETPFAIDNRPGLSAIAYRVGTHVQFKASMLARLSGADVPELGNLKTRDDADFTIALLDAFAVVSDVLTFYQERIANESFLRTATERQSIIELARLIGYELRPGVAASTYLVFTLESGVGAPSSITLDERLKVQSVPGPGQKPQTFETVESIEARPAWNVLTPRRTDVHFPAATDTGMLLAGVTTNLKTGDAILIVGAERLASKSNTHWAFRRITAIEIDTANDRTLIRWSGALTDAEVPKSDPRVYALRLRASVFGYNAQDFSALPVALRVGDVNPDPKATGDDKFLKGAFADQKDKWADKVFANTVTSVNLDSVYSQVLPDSWLVLTSAADVAVFRVTSVVDEAKSQFNISAKSTRAAIDGINIEKFSPRTAGVYAQSEELALAPTPLLDPVWKKEIVLDGRVDGLTKGRTLLFSGRRLPVTGVAPGGDGETIHEVATLEEAVLSEDLNRTILHLASDLTNVFDRATTLIHANVAFSTHGETIPDEILGSGDAGRAYQHFTLKQAPLTYTSADTASGGESTLEVRVNDLKWTEVETLFGRGPRERIYLTETEDDGTTTVQFGDGITGARLPKGRENVKAAYRKGIGLEGLLDAGQLSLLMTRPLGLKSVTNPVPTAGAQDPQLLNDARANAPVTVLTLERIVSLQDFQDFARNFSGIAKAQATWTWSGHARRVFVTVAGIDGAAVDATLSGTLVSAMQKAGDELVPVAIRSYRGVTFKVVADVKLDPAFIREKVLAGIETALRAAFSFDARSFGQPVTLSEVVAVIQNVAGVVAVDVNRLHRSERPQTRETFLPADSPRVGAGASALAAELLTLDRGPLQLTVLP
jgi:predicted phage baseplate assembly protein